MFRFIAGTLCLILSLFSCTAEHGIDTVGAELTVTELNSAEQEVKNRLYFLEQYVGMEHLTTENFPGIYQAIFDPLPAERGVRKSLNCASCDYVPSSCYEFGLYLNLLSNSCRSEGDNPIDFCALYESCSRCCIDNCTVSGCSTEVDPCSNCPTGYNCENGVCVEQQSDCDRYRATVDFYSGWSMERWAGECGFTLPLVIFGPGYNYDQYLNCPARLEYYRAQNEVLFCNCQDAGFDDLCECLC